MTSTRERTCGCRSMRRGGAPRAARPRRHGRRRRPSTHKRAPASPGTSRSRRPETARTRAPCAQPSGAESPRCAHAPPKTAGPDRAPRLASQSSRARATLWSDEPESTYTTGGAIAPARLERCDQALAFVAADHDDAHALADWIQVLHGRQRICQTGGGTAFAERRSPRTIALASPASRSSAKRRGTCSSFFAPPSPIARRTR